MTPETKAHGIFLEAVKKHGAFDRSLKQARADGMDAAFLFVQARAAIPHGEWGDFLELHRDRISPRTVRFYCQLADEAVEWVKISHPKLKTLTEVREAARTMVMQSPKPLIALGRELGHIRKFGEYDAVKYAVKKSKGGAVQIELDFDTVFASVERLTHFGDENFIITYPEGKDELEAISELETKLETALARVRDIKKNGKPIEA